MDEERVRSIYQDKFPLFKQVLNLAEKELEERFSNKKIIVHDINSRIKEIDSFLDKAKRKSLENPFVEIKDIVGLRVVALFRTEMDIICRIIRDCFYIQKEENKIEDSDIDSFGYMSIHFQATLKKKNGIDHAEDIAELPFEIQVRTMVMDAWASISHHLEYKQISDVPTELRKDFHALSGLFYIADTHFGMILTQKEKGQERTLEALKQTAMDQEINLDTLTVYLRNKFPDRTLGPLAFLSTSINEFHRLNYRSIRDLDRTASKMKDRFLQFEKNKPPITIIDGNLVQTKFSALEALRSMVDFSK